MLGIDSAFQLGKLIQDGSFLHFVWYAFRNSLPSAREDLILCNRGHIYRVVRRLNIYPGLRSSRVVDSVYMLWTPWRWLDLKLKLRIGVHSIQFSECYHRH